MREEARGTDSFLDVSLVDAGIKYDMVAFSDEADYAIYWSELKLEVWKSNLHESYRTNSAQTVPQQVYATALHFTIMQCKLYQYVYTRMSIHYLLRTGSRSSRGGMMEDGALTAE